MDATTETALRRMTTDDAAAAEAPALTGWLEKQGHVVKNWKRRYFAMFSRGQLAYYTSDNRARSALRGFVTLSGASVHDDGDSDGVGAFVIRDARGKTFRLRTTPEDAARWVRALRAELEGQREGEEGEAAAAKFDASPSVAVASSMTPAQRREAAVLGTFVADAATMPLHWIYDDAKMREVLAGGGDALFHPTASSPFYSSADFPGHYAVGQLSPYGEQALGALRLLATRSDFARPSLNGDDWAGALREWQRGYTGRLDGMLNKFEQNMADGKRYPETGGADEDQAQFFGKLAAAVLRFDGTAGDGEANEAEADARFEARLDVIVRAHQNNALAVRAARFWAALLRAVVAGADVRSALATARARTLIAAAFDDGTPESEAITTLERAIERVEDNVARGVGVREMLMEFGAEVMPSFPAAGLSCHNPHATMGALHVLLTHGESRQQPFRAALDANARAGGDSCSRATLIGAVLGARHGVPADLSARAEIAPVVEGLIAIARLRAMPTAAPLPAPAARAEKATSAEPALEPARTASSEALSAKANNAEADAEQTEDATAEEAEAGEERPRGSSLIVSAPEAAARPELSTATEEAEAMAEEDTRLASTPLEEADVIATDDAPLSPSSREEETDDSRTAKKRASVTRSVRKTAARLSGVSHFFATAGAA